MQDLSRAALVEVAPASVLGRPSRRMIFVFLAPGCAYARSPAGGCSMCGYINLSTMGLPVSEEQLISQAEGEYKVRDFVSEGIEEIDLYNSGSFFNDEEIPPVVRIRVLSLIGEHPFIKKVMVESRPEYIDRMKIREAKISLKGKILEVGIGLESASDYVREIIINKGFNKEEFERSVGVLAAEGASLLVYALLKPRYISEKDAIVDSIETIKYAFSLGERFGLGVRIGLEPVFVAKGSKVEADFLEGKYMPPSLWSVISVLSSTHQLGEIQVGLSDEGLAEGRTCHTCDRCHPLVFSAIEGFNMTQDIGAFASLSCACREESKRMLDAH